MNLKTEAARKQNHAKCSLKLTFLTPWHIHLCAYGRSCSRFRKICFTLFLFLLRFTFCALSPTNFFQAMLRSVSRYHQGCCKAFKHYKKIWKKDSAFCKVQILFRTLWTNERVINNYARDLGHLFSAYAKFLGKTNISYPKGVKMICFWKKVVYVASEWFLADFRSLRGQFFENRPSKICVRCFF